MVRCNVIGVRINATNMKDTLDNIQKNLKVIKGEYICVSNVHTTIMAYENEDYKKIQNSSFMSLPDGKPLSIICNQKGYKNTQRVTGPDLMEQLFKISEINGYTHYFYGSTDETLNELKNKLKTSHPNLKIEGAYSPPFRELTEAEDKKIIHDINKTNPDFLWVGLGAPKQEIWMYEHRSKINSLMIGVGAGFDYCVGNIKRAPKWMQNLSLEWLYRLMQEPKRLWKRYLKTNILFIFLILKHSILKMEVD